jgi:hypothetical protein
MEDEMGRECSMGGLRNAWKLEEKGLLEWCRHGWEVNIRMDLNEIELKDM